MTSKKFALVAALAIVICGIMMMVMGNTNADRVLYQEDFENDYSMSGSSSLRCSDNSLYLDTSDPSYTGGGEWNKNVSLPPGKISWQWAGDDLEGFQFWLKLTFSNHKSIYYVTDGSMNPKSDGKYYRDEEERMRFSPSIVISGVSLGVVQRDVREDYAKYCGSFDDIEIIRITVGMSDEDPERRNRLSISNIMIYR